MEYVYAALLLHKAGKEITEDAIGAIISAAGMDVDSVRVKALVAALDGVDIEEAISKTAIAAPVAATPAPEAAPEEAPAEAEEEKKIENEDSPEQADPEVAREETKHEEERINLEEETPELRQEITPSTISAPMFSEIPIAPTGSFLPPTVPSVNTIAGSSPHLCMPDYSTSQCTKF